MNESFIDVINEYISFVNGQSGSYMDALAGFKGHRVNIERQIHRTTSPSGIQFNAKKQPKVVYVSYEDPSQPDIILNRIIRTDDYIADNSESGFNEQQQACAILIFLFTYWEDEIRPRLAIAKGVKKDEISSDIMGDLRIIRNAILHTKRIIRESEHKKLKKLKKMFVAEHPIHISYTNMHQIFTLIKQDLAKMLNIPNQFKNIVDIAIQKHR